MDNAVDVQTAGIRQAATGRMSAGNVAGGKNIGESGESGLIGLRSLRVIQGAQPPLAPERKPDSSGNPGRSGVVPGAAVGPAADGVPTRSVSRVMRIRHARLARTLKLRRSTLLHQRQVMACLEMSHLRCPGRNRHRPSFRRRKCRSERMTIAARTFRFSRGQPG